MRLAERSMARNSDPETSHIAAAEATCNADDEIVRLLEESSHRKPTGMVVRDILEILVATGYDTQSITSRFIKLREAGKVKWKLNSEGIIITRRSKHSKKRGNVYLAGDGRKSLVKTKKSKLDLAQEEIETLKAENRQLKTKLSEAETIAVRIWKSRIKSRKRC